jgi:monoamine oxidase
MASTAMTDVLVIGAGAAGLSAASVVAQGGYSVRVLEARDRIGGRIFSLREPNLAVAVELGGEYVQGVAQRTLDLAAAANAVVVEVNGVGFRWTDSRLVVAAPARRTATDAFDQVERFRGRDRSLQSVLDETASARPELRDDMRDAARWVEGYDAADPSIISIRSLLKERRREFAMHAERSFRLPRGYVAILEYCRSTLAADALQLNTTVKCVEWQSGEVTVHTTAGQTFSARKLIVTLPLPILQHNLVTFEPALVDKSKAVRGLRMGAVIKLGLIFDDAFWWTNAQEELGFLQAPGQTFPVFWTSYPVLAPLLIGWCAGPNADVLSRLRDEEILERALRELSRIFKQRVASRLRGWHLHNWQTDPLAGGAYSYVAVGGETSQRALARPIAGTLFFAGEATDWSGQHATVYGALMSGERAAREALSSDR